MATVTNAHRLLVVLAVGALASCGGSAPPPAPAPATPEATIELFLDAANAGDLNGMETLWGSEAGPNSVTKQVSGQARVQRLTIMQRLLRSDSRQLASSDNTQPTRPVRTYEIVQGTRRLQVPFTCVTSRYGGWLIQEIGLEAAMPAAGPRN